MSISVPMLAASLVLAGCIVGEEPATEDDLDSIDATTCGPPNYCAYTGTDIVPQPATPSMGGLVRNDKLYFDTSFVSHGVSKENLSPVYRCTDANTSPGEIGAGYSAGIGGSGAGVLWNKNSTLLRVNRSGGAYVIVQHDKVNHRCANTALTQDKNVSDPGPAAAAASFGQGNFSLSDPSIWYSFGLSVIPYQINWTSSTSTKFCGRTTTPGQFCELDPVADFTYGLPISAATVKAWQPGHAYRFGDTMAYTLTVGEAPQWVGSKSTYALGDLIQVNGCAYKKYRSGTTGKTTPNFPGKCGTGVVADNGEPSMWRGIGGPAIFVYQLTSAGTNQVSGSAISLRGANPDFRSVITDNGHTWTNIGPMVKPVWDGWGGTSRDGTKFTMGFSTNTYGGDGDYASSNVNGGQGSGVFVSQYDSLTNTYHLLNTGTGISTDYICQGGTGPRCAGGQSKQITRGHIESQCRWTIHNAKMSNTGTYILIARQVSLTSTCPANGASVWRPLETPFSTASAVKFIPWGMNHWALGKDHYVSTSNAGLPLALGVHAIRGSLAYPEDASQMSPIWTIPGCDPKWQPGSAKPACKSSLFDNHVGWANNANDTDNVPACSSNYGYAPPTIGLPTVHAYQNELMCVSTTANLADQKQWRFTHMFQTQANRDFGTQFTISQVSQEGRYLAFSSDWGPGPTGSGTLGSVDNTAACTGGLPWKASTAYALNRTINPIAGLSGTGANYGVYKAVAVTGKTGATEPDWESHAHVGDRLRDGGVTWESQGPGNCRGDVFIVELN